MKQSLFVLILLSFLLTACSSVQRSSTPFWEEEYQTKYKSSLQRNLDATPRKVGIDAGVYADRINGWPAFYKLGDALSVLWPVFMSSPMGHAVFPLYEYAYEPQRLFMAAYLVGSYKDTDVWGDPQRGRSGYYVFPAWFYTAQNGEQKWNYLLVGKVRTTTGTLTNNLCPLWFYNSEKDRWSIVLGPGLVGYGQRKNTTSNWVFLFWFYDHNSKTNTQSAYYLAGLGGEKTTSHTLKNYLMPFWYYKHNDKYKETTVVSLPYTSIESKEKTYQSVLFPFTHFWQTPDSTGQLVLPLYGWTRYPKEKKAWMFNSLLFNYRAGSKSLVNVGGPLYYHSEEGEHFYTTAFWPLYHAWSDYPGDKNYVLLPLGRYMVDEREGSGSIGGALFYQRHWDKHGEWSFFTPLVGQWKHKEGEEGQWVAPLFIRKANEKRNEQDFYSPLLSYEKDTTNTWTNVLLLGGGSEKMEYGSSTWLLGNLLNWGEYKTTGKRWGMSALFVPLLDVDRTGFMALGNAYHNPMPSANNEDKQVQQRITWNEESIKTQQEYDRKHTKTTETLRQRDYTRHETLSRTSWDVFPLVWSWEKATYPIRPGITVEQSKKEAMVEKNLLLLPLYYQTSETDAQGVKSADKNLLGGVWHAQRERETKDGQVLERIHNRLLFKVVDYRRDGTRTALDAFPFITADSDSAKDYKRVSFLGPVFRKTHENNKTEWQVLGMKF
jgi:hypothetical protein